MTARNGIGRFDRKLRDGVIPESPRRGNTGHARLRRRSPNRPLAQPGRKSTQSQHIQLRPQPLLATASDLGSIQHGHQPVQVRATQHRRLGQSPRCTVRLEKYPRKQLGLRDPLDPTQTAPEQRDHQPRRVEDPRTTSDQRAAEIRTGPVGDHQPATVPSHQQVPSIEIAVQDHFVVLGRRQPGHTPGLDTPWFRQPLAPTHRQPHCLVNRRQRSANSLRHRSHTRTATTNQPTPHRLDTRDPLEIDSTRIGIAADQTRHFEQPRRFGNRRSSTCLLGLDHRHQTVLTLDHSRWRQHRQPRPSNTLANPVANQGGFLARTINHPPTTTPQKTQYASHNQSALPHQQQTGTDDRRGQHDRRGQGEEGI